MVYHALVGLIQRAWSWFTVASALPANFEADPPPRPIADVLAEMAGMGLLPRAGRPEALSVPAVQRGRNLICSISTLPLFQHNAAFEVVRHPLLEQIDPDIANVVTLAQTVEDLLFEGISWWQIVRFGADGYPTFARHLDYSSVSLQPPGGRSPAPLPGGYDPRGAVIYVDGLPVPGTQVIRFDSPNPGLLKAAGRVIRRAVLFDTTSCLYADNPRPLDYFSPAEGADPADDKEIQRVLSEWNAFRKRRATAYVPFALRYNSVDTPSPADLQLVELQKQATLELANALGLDPEDLGISTTSRTYQNGTDRRQDRINDVLSPYMKAITDRLSMGDTTRRGHRIAFDLDDYLRADPLTRANFYHFGIEDGWLAPSEARSEERRPKMTPAQKAETAPPPAQPATLPDNVRPIRPLAASFGTDVDLLVFETDLPRPRVNWERRTIEGIAVPYGPTQIAWKNGQRYRFAEGSLHYVEPRRNKLLRDHDTSQSLGYLQTADERPEGMFVNYHVPAGVDGDRALAEAENGVRDGLSPGVEIVNYVDDPLNRGVFLVTFAEWRETSVVAIPAFDNARVTRVTASRETGDRMDPCSTCGQPHATGAPCVTPTPPPAPEPVLRLNDDQLRALLGQPDVFRALAGVPSPAVQQPEQAQFALYPGQIDALLRTPGALAVLLGAGAPIPPEPRQVVDPTRPTAVTQVVEPPPYRFDRKGNLTRGAFDFSSDVIAGLRDGDTEALHRAEEFVHAQFTAFDTDMADAATLNPNRQRPDLYVDQKEFTYPIWGAIEKGTLADATPFTLPKFNTSSGLVGAHVEGTEPTAGVFTATSQTITPSAVSGKVSITREAWDQGGNPQLSGLIWRQMVRAWYEALEASAVTTLDNLSPTQITLSTAAQDDVLVGELEQALAVLQFVRGGFRMRDFFLQVDLYKALVAATDADGRKLLPMLGPVNANGQSSEFFADLAIGGLRGRPGWALAASGTVAASSYLFDRNDVSGWATAPRRLTFENVEVRYVHVGIWGYKALANTDLTGVREIVYDPS